MAIDSPPIQIGKDARMRRKKKKSKISNKPSMMGNILKYGSGLAAAGGLAYGAYKKWNDIKSSIPAPMLWPISNKGGGA